MSVLEEDLFEQQMLGNYNQESEQVYKVYNKQPAQKKQFDQCKIMLKEESTLNKKIINYFMHNLRKLNARDLMFEWIIVYEDEVEFYEEQDITKFPTAIYKDSQITGVSRIIDFLEEFLEDDTPVIKSTKKVSKISNDSDVRDYLYNAIKDSDGDSSDDSGDGDLSKDLSRKFAEMTNARKNVGMHIGMNGSSNPEIHEKNKRKSVRFEDDEPPKDKKKSQKRRSRNYDEDIDNIELPKFDRGRRHSKKEQEISTEPTDLIKSGKRSEDPVEDDMMSKFWENQTETEI
jgi:hypothetical protein